MPETSVKSKLLDRLKDVQRGKVASLGFGFTADDPRKMSSFLVIAELVSADVALVRGAVEAGADGIILPVGGLGPTGALEHLRDAVGEAIVGVDLGEGLAPDSAQLDRLADSGCDFIVASPERAPARLLANERMARMVRISVDMPTALLRALGEIDIEVVAGGPDPARHDVPDLTVFDLMQYRQVTGFLRQPTVIIAQQANAVEALQLLRDLGALGVIVPSAQLSGGPEAIASTIARFRAEADKVKRPRRGHASDAATLPRVSPSVPFGGGEEEEPDDDPDEGE